MLKNKQDLQFDSPVKMLSIQGNEILLKELLSNLLANAMTYAGPNSHIVVTLEAGAKPALIVADDGPGIPEYEMDKIFERFYRIPGSRGKGSGLGLAIVKEIADLHGADLQLKRSAATGGLTIKIVFIK